LEYLDSLMNSGIITLTVFVSDFQQNVKDNNLINVPIIITIIGKRLHMTISCLLRLSYFQQVILKVIFITMYPC
jgi:hypothetical protein